MHVAPTQALRVSDAMTIFFAERRSFELAMLRPSQFRAQVLFEDWQTFK